jgi:formate hydrogenlyase subunit 3/multisubunit Na+/H+ antiporter MnhD subunit
MGYTSLLLFLLVVGVVVSMSSGAGVTANYLFFDAQTLAMVVLLGLVALYWLWISYGIFMEGVMTVGLLIVGVFFLVSSLLRLYVAFERALVPTLVLVLGWGYQVERLQASFYLLMYTFVLSLPFLIGMVGILMWRQCSGLLWASMGVTGTVS